MTTKTTNAADELTRLEAAVREARQEHVRIRREAQTHQAKLAATEAEVSRLAKTEPDEFDATGAPKRGTAAAKLTAEIQKGRDGARWPDLIAGTDQAVHAAEHAVAEHRAEHAVELATSEYRLGETLTAKVSELAEELLCVLDEIGACAARLGAITAACPGRIDGRDVLVDGRLEALKQALRHHGNFQAPRSATLTPLEGETPVLLRSTSGGWIAGGHGGDNYDAEQPPRVEAR